MKNKEVIIFLIISLVIVSPIVAADNFLSGYSILDKAGNFFSNAVNFFKGIFGKEKVGIMGNMCDPQINEKRCLDETHYQECDEEEREWITYPCSQNKICVDEGECTFCGNGNLEEGEACDYNRQNPNNPQFGEKTCVTETQNEQPQRPEGNLICTEQCIIDTSRCSVPLRSADEGGLATFQKYALIVDTFPMRGGTVETNPEGTSIGSYIEVGGEVEGVEYNQGTSVTLTAIPNQNYRFVRWYGDVPENIQETNPIIIQMNENKEITAKFESYYTLSIYNKPENTEGKVKVNDQYYTQPIIYPQQPPAQVTLTAIFDTRKGYSFKEWIGTNNVVLGYQNPITITIDDTKLIKAFFNETICNDKIDNDKDNLIDCNDEIDCKPNIEHVGGFKCIDRIIKESNCSDGTDNDKDNTIDSLDKDCGEGLKITEIDFAGDEFLEYSKIPIIDCSYEIIPTISSELVKNCINLTLNNRNMECSSKRAIQNLENQEIGFIEFTNCNVGNIENTVAQSEEEKNIICEVNGLCNGYKNQNENQEFSKKSKSIIVSEFDICSESENKPLQKQQGISVFDTFTITSPAERATFNKGGKLNTVVQVRNKFKDENNIGSSIDAKVEAKLISSTTFEEVATETSEETTIIYLGTKNFNLELAIPPDIENDNYRLYVKVYRDGYEEEICRSTSKAVSIIQQAPLPPEDNGGECNDTDEDGFCSEEDCDDSDSEINPEAEEICTDGIDNNCNGLTDYADSACQTIPGQGRGGEPGPEAGGEGISQADSDNDGLPDYWEYNFFSDLSQGPNDDFDNDRISNIDEYRFNTNPKVSDKKKSSILWTILLIILGIGVITLITMIIIKKLKNRGRSISNSQNYSLDQSNQNKLQSFIQQAKSQGMNRQQIKNALLNAGWKEQDINKFL